MKYALLKNVSMYTYLWYYKCNE